MKVSPDVVSSLKQADTLAAIDIGSNSIRMSLGQLTADGEIEILESIQRAVRLGQDTFKRGRLGRLAMRAAVMILKDLKRILDLYDVKNVWTVATSTVREASNSDIFRDRVFMATGLEVDVLDTLEESRLTVSAVQSQIGENPDLVGKNTIIAEVGGGSTVLTVLKNGQITTSRSLALGSIRMLEVFISGSEPWEQVTKIVHDEIESVLSSIETLLPLKKIDTFFAVGADARFAAKQIGIPLSETDLSTVTRKKFDRLISKISNYSPEQIVDTYALPFADAETLNTALLVYQGLLHATKAKAITVCSVSMRDGLLLDLARRITGKEDKSLENTVIQSALSLAEKYKVNIERARKLEALSIRLFNELQSEHGLTFRHRLLLQTAALLNKIGTFISSRAYHKHSFYLISNSEVFGLTQKEMVLVAHIARYHRRSRPKPSHVEYMQLPRERRIIVNKLAAILRMAEALCTANIDVIEQVKFHLTNEDFIISLPGRSDITLKRRSVESKSDLFEDTYGLQTHIDES